MWHSTSLLAARGVGERAVVAAVPESVVALCALLTHLGDPATVMVLLAVGYLLAGYLDVSPARLAAALGLGFGALALTVALKHAFALPRPPGATVDGYGFPSGHALGSTVVYGGLAALLPVRDSTRRRYVAVAAGLVTVVALTRVVVGVHYLVDVVAGVGVGVAYLAVGLRLGPGWGPDRVSVAAVRRVFALAVVAGVAGLLVVVGRETAAAFGAALGGWVAWRLLGDAVVGHALSRFETGVAFLFVPPLVVGFGVVPEAHVPVAATAALMASLVAVLVAVPRLAASLTG